MNEIYTWKNSNLYQYSYDILLTSSPSSSLCLSVSLLPYLIKVPIVEAVVAEVSSSIVVSVLLRGVVDRGAVVDIVPQPVSVSVCVTLITEAVEIDVHLVVISNAGTVVAGIAKSISVKITLVRVVYVDTVVLWREKILRDREKE